MIISAMILTVVPVLGFGRESDLERFQYSQLHMGVRVNVTLYAEGEERAVEAAKAMFAQFARLEDVMSDYRPDSELMQLCARAGAGPVSVSQDLFTVLARASELAERTDGAFDVTCGPMVKVWREARRTGMMPSREALLAARAKSGWRKMILNRRQRTVTLAVRGMSIDLGGIAKGYACDAAIAVSRAMGISSALVEAGGDIVCSGAPPNSRGWRVSIHGRASSPVWLRNGAISTSGDSEQFVQIGKIRYSHILDPRTGLGTTTGLQATVLARRGVDSDSLATALCVLGEAKGRKLVESYGADAIFVRSSGP